MIVLHTSVKDDTRFHRLLIEEKMEFGGKNMLLLLLRLLRQLEAFALLFIVLGKLIHGPEMSLKDIDFCVGSYIIYRTACLIDRFYIMR